MKHLLRRLVHLPKKQLAVLAVLLVIALAAAAYTFTPLRISITRLFSSPSSLEQYAQEVIATCAKDTYPPGCYDKEIPKLMDRGVSMEDAFAVTALIQNQVHDYFYCHVLGHNLAAKETAKNPTDWTKVIARCPTGMCSNGCLHGAAQERFRDDALTAQQVQDITPQLATICQSDGTRNFTGLEQASCYHSLGHLTMYITGAKIDDATKVCDAVAKVGSADFTQTCYEGAYMQIFQPLEPEDFGLVKDIPAKTIPEAETFCDSFTGERRAACHRESWPLYRDGLEKPAGLIHFCSLVPDPASVTRCYNAMFYVLTAQFNFDAERIIPVCEGLDADRKGQCFANAASRFIETDYRLTEGAVHLCKVAEEHGVGERCYTELLFYSTFNFHPGSESFTGFCKALPEPWSARCLNGDGSRIRLGP